MPLTDSRLERETTFGKSFDRHLNVYNLSCNLTFLSIDSSIHSGMIWIGWSIIQFKGPHVRISIVDFSLCKQSV